MRITVERQPAMPPPQARRSPGNPIIPFIRRHAVAAYYVLAFALSWGGIALVAGPDGMFSTGTTMSITAGVALTAGPFLAAVTLTALLDGRPGFRRLGTRLRRWRVEGRWYLVALLTGPLVMGGTAYGLSLASSGFYHGFASLGDMSGTVLTGLTLGLVVGFCEELGWTGFALPKLRQRHGLFTTGLVMGLLWGVWHFPMFAGSTDRSGTPSPALLVAVFLFAWLPPYRVLMVWVYDRTESLLIAVLMHVPIAATAPILAAVASEATSGIALLIPALVWGAAFWLIIAAVAWANGGRLTQRGAAPS